MKWVQRLFGLVYLAFFVAMQVWAAMIWESQGPPPPLAYLAEVFMVIVGAFIGLEIWMTERDD